MTRLIPAILVMALLLTGCSGNSESKESAKSAKREAAEVNTQLGTEYLNRGQYEISLEKLRKAVRADADYAPAHTVLGVLYERLGEIDKAGDELKEAVRLTPDDGAANNNYGAFLCRNGQPENAEAYFLKALDDPFYRTPEVAMANAGACALEQNELDKAESYLRKSLDYNPQFPDPLLSLSEIAYLKEEYLTATGFLQRYESVAPFSAESLMLGYRIETARNNEPAADRYRALVLERFPDSAQAQSLQGSRRR